MSEDPIMSPTGVYWVIPDPSSRPWEESKPLTFPVQCRYDGTSEYGYTQWSVPFPPDVREGMYLHIGWMDAKHAIVVREKND